MANSFGITLLSGFWCAATVGWVARLSAQLPARFAARPGCQIHSFA
jgi:hypothetical protein